MIHPFNIISKEHDRASRFRRIFLTQGNDNLAQDFVLLCPRCAWDNISFSLLPALKPSLTKKVNSHLPEIKGCVWTIHFALILVIISLSQGMSKTARVNVAVFRQQYNICATCFKNIPLFHTHSLSKPLDTGLIYYVQLVLSVLLAVFYVIDYSVWRNLLAHIKSALYRLLHTKR